MNTTTRFRLPLYLITSYLAIIVGIILVFHQALPAPVPVSRLVRIDSTAVKEITGLLTSDATAVFSPLSENFTHSIPDRSARGFSALAGLYTLIWFILLVYKKIVKPNDLYKALGLYALSLLAAAAVGFGGAQLYNLIWNTSGGSYLSSTINTIKLLYYLVTFIVSLAVLLPAYIAARRAFGRQTALAGGMIIFCALNGVTMFLLPRIVYLFTLPMLALLLWSLLIQYNKRFIARLNLRIVYGVAACIAVLMLYSPVIYLLFTMLSSELLFVSTLLIGLGALPVGVMFSSAFTVKAADIMEAGEPESALDEFFEIGFFDQKNKDDWQL